MAQYEDPKKKKLGGPVEHEAQDLGPMGAGIPRQAPLAQAAQQAPAPQAPKPQGQPAGSSLRNSYQSISGIDPSAPIRGMQSAQNEMGAAATQMGEAQNTPISAIRGILGTIAGAGVGAALGGEAGAQFGSGIVEAPRRRAVGLAQGRMDAAKSKFETESKMGEAVARDQVQFTAMEGEERQQKEAEAKRVQGINEAAQRERELFAPTEAGGDIIQAPRYAPEGGGAPSPHNLGEAPGAKSASYRVDVNGNLLATVIGGDGVPVTSYVKDPATGKNAQFPVDQADDMARFMDGFVKANPNATEAQKVQAMLNWKATGPAVVVNQANAGREAVSSQAAQELVGRIQNHSTVKAAAASGDPNAYKAAVEALLAGVRQNSPSYTQYVDEARTQLLRALPTRPPQGNSIDQTLKSIRDRNQATPAAQ